MKNNRFWIDLFASEFNVTNTVAKEMLSAIMSIKSLDSKLKMKCCLNSLYGKAVTEEVNANENENT